MLVFHVLCNDIFNEGGLSGAWPAEDVQAASPLHVAYFDFFYGRSYTFDHTYKFMTES